MPLYAPWTSGALEPTHPHPPTPLTPRSHVPRPAPWTVKHTHTPSYLKLHDYLCMPLYAPVDWSPRAPLTQPSSDPALAPPPPSTIECPPPSPTNTHAQGRACTCGRAGPQQERACARCPQRAWCPNSPPPHPLPLPCVACGGPPLPPLHRCGPTCPRAPRAGGIPMRQCITQARPQQERACACCPNPTPPHPLPSPRGGL